MTTINPNQPTPGKPAFTIPSRPETSAPKSAPTAAPVKRPAGLTKPAGSQPAKAPLPKRPAFTAKKADTGKSSKKYLFELFDECGDQGVSDLHVQPENGQWREIEGRLQVFDDEKYIVTEEDILHWMTHSDNYEDLHLDSPEKLLEGKGHTTVAFDTGNWRVRGSFRKSTVGVSATFRLIPNEIPTIDKFGVPGVMQSLVRRSSGLILIEGPTGSGKTTSIAALINMVNQTTNRHIYSIEDPIEFHHKPIDSTVFTMREIGVHAEDYASAVENALRSKPHIIFVGEMLNNETKKAALHAATTGHLVITTAHAGSAAEAIDSFIGGFSAEEQPQIRSRLSQSLLGIMCQTLVTGKNGKLAPAHEIMINDINFQEIINEGNMQMLSASMSGTTGSFTLEDSLMTLVQEDRITPEVALDKAKRRTALMDEFDRAGIHYDI